MSLPPAFLDEIRTRTSIVSVVGRRVKLVRAGREWKACCPFHNERTPSFFVNEEKGFYHCFSCGAHGDAIRFLTEHDGLSFLDAVKQLAGEAGLEMPKPQYTREARRRASLSQLLEKATRWFSGVLESNTGAEARAYLDKRQVSPAARQHFCLGFAPAQQGELHQLLARTFPEMKGRESEILLAAGLIGEQEGRQYARFRNRLLFPIHNPRGKVVGFGGRTLRDEQPKYLNSADSPLFSKGHLLYNYHRAAAAARKTQQLLIVEGYMDVVGLHGAGFEQAVAPLGTALTPEQIALAWRLVDSPAIAFDGDTAGIRAGHRAALRALPLLAPGKSLSFIALPKGQDPDDIARTSGTAGVHQILESAKPLNAFLFEAERLAFEPLDTPERRAAFLTRLEELAGDIRHETIARDYRHTWRQRYYALLKSRNPRPYGAKAQEGRNAPLPALRPETRTAASSSDAFLGNILKALATRPGAALRHQELLLALPLEDEALKVQLNALFDASPPGGLKGPSLSTSDSGFPDHPGGRREDSLGDSPGDEEFDERIRRALATLAELHHIEQEMALRDCSDEEAFAREYARRAALGKARAKIRKRLARWAMEQENPAGETP